MPGEKPIRLYLHGVLPCRYRRIPLNMPLPIRRGSPLIFKLQIIQGDGVPIPDALFLQPVEKAALAEHRSEEHTSELQSHLT